MRLLQMIAHGGARSQRIARCDRIANDNVLQVRLRPGRRILDVTRQLLEIRIDAQIEELADEAHHHCVVENSGDRGMKPPVKGDQCIAGGLLIDLVQNFIEPLDVLGSRPDGRLFGDGAFNEGTRPQQLQRSLDRGAARHHSGNLLLDHINARANPDLEAALDLKGDQRLAYSRARNPQPIGQHALSRQTAANGIFALVDQMTELIGNLAIKAAGLYGLKGQSVYLGGRFRGDCRSDTAVSWSDHLTSEPGGMSRALGAFAGLSHAKV